MVKAALDVGGANIKGAREDGLAVSHPFQLWRTPRQLPEAIGKILEILSPFESLAVTMTGELCDCYASRSEGVRHILGSVGSAAANRVAPGKVTVWTLDGRLVVPEEAFANTRAVAAANWLALAAWAASRTRGGDGILVDVGSTTTDVVALKGGRPCPHGLTDTARLASGELVYSAAERTPVCSLLQEVLYRGRRTRIATELFATTLDVYLTLGEIEEDPRRTDTADGREAIRERARDRLARMICADPRDFAPEDARGLAEQAAAAQLASLVNALGQVIERNRATPEVAVISGCGEHLARKMVEAVSIPRTVPVSELAGAEVSGAACAYALTQLPATP